MQRIDAHQHFWTFDPVRDSWIIEEMSTLRRDFSPGDLEPILREHGFNGSVAVQADQSEKETFFLVKLAAENSFIKGIVGWVDLQTDDIAERLQHFRQFPIIKGFRHILQGEKDRAFMLTPAFKRGIGALKKMDYSYDLLVYPDQLKYTRELIASFPEQKFVLDHLGKPDIKNRHIEEWVKDIKDLALLPNMYCKVSGMVTEADWKSWKKDDFRHVLDTVVAAFGTRRLMYGSDWPVCQLAATYKEVLDIVQDYFSAFSKSEQDGFFGGNASTFYNL